MKKIFFVFCCSLCFLNAKSQTHLFGEYSAQKVTTSTPDNKNDRYKWLLEKKDIICFFLKLLMV